MNVVTAISITVHMRDFKLQESGTTTPSDTIPEARTQPTSPGKPSRCVITAVTHCSWS